MHSLLRLSLVGMLAFALASCGGSGTTPTPTPSPTPSPSPSPSPNPTPTPTPRPGGSGISGVVTSPLGSAAGAIVLACYTEACDGASDGQSSEVMISDPSGAYSVPVPAGSYAVLAIQDGNGDGRFGSGDYLGAYPSAVTSPSSGINFTLEKYTETASRRLDVSRAAVDAAVRRIGNK